MLKQLHHPNTGRPAGSRRCAALLLSLILGVAGMTSHGQSSTSYDWKNVKIGGGGFITHIVPDYKTPGTLYARTDTGGAYKRSTASGGQWVALTDLFGPSDSSLTGVESIAVDPVNPKFVYIAVGSHTGSGQANGAILASQDGGATFTRTNLSIQLGGDDQGRFSGERLAVNPQKDSEIYFGSRNNGLWRSEDFGKTWAQVASFPVTGPTSGVGVIFETFAPKANVVGPKGTLTETIYAGVSDPNVGLYSSGDNGVTWSPVAGQPTGLYPTNYDLSTDGNLYITYGNAVGPDTLYGQGMSAGELYKYNTATGVWAAVTPPEPWNGVNGGYQSQNSNPFGFSAVSVDRQNPKTIMVATMGELWWPGEEIYRSLDAGATWWPIGSEPNWSEPGPLYNFSSRTDQLAPWWSGSSCSQSSCDLTAAPFGSWLGALVIDPFNSNHVLYGNSNNLWETQNVSNVDTRQVIDWTVGANGIEQTSASLLLSPSQGVPLFSVVNNAGAFRHTSLGASPSSGTILPNFTPSSMDYAQNAPNIVVAVNGGQGAYSTDNGATWNSFTTPGGGIKNITVSADGKHWVALTGWNNVVYSTDNGNSWNNASGLSSVNTWAEHLASDRVNPLGFYVYDHAAGLVYRSADGGVTFPIITGAPQWGGGIQVGFTAEGDLWIYNWQLNHSADKGVTFNVPSGSIDSFTALGFGAPAPGSANATLFLAGQVSGVYGIFRSVNGGGNWTQVNDATHQWISIQAISGDPKAFGRVYIGTSNRGILYGDDPAVANSPSKSNPVLAWTPASPISVGAVLSGSQLDATASYGGKSLPGSFIYTPALGTVLSTTGTKTLSVQFLPADYAHYNAASKTVTVMVNGGSLKTASIAWNMSAPISYGTALSSTQLDATVNYPGTLTYSPALGTVLGGGAQTLTVTFTPSNPAIVAPASATKTITVSKTTPGVAVIPSAGTIKAAQDLGLTITVTGTGSTPTGSVVLTSGKYTSFAAPLISGTATFTVPSGSLATATDKLTVTYVPDVASAGNYNSAAGTAQVTVVPLIKPTVIVTPDATTLPYAENLTITATVSGGSGNPTPTGSVLLTTGNFSASAGLSNGTASFYLQPGTLPKGSNPLTVVYTPDGTGASSYTAATGTSPLNLTAPGSTSISVNINTLANRHLISPYIYGLNNTVQTDVTGMSPTFVRMGGNAASDFNWLNSHYNAAADYFFEDFGFNDGYGHPYSVTDFTKFVVNAGSQELNTMPLLNWVAKSSGSSFSVAKYGPQCATDRWNSDAGDGLKPDCSTPIIADPSDAYYPMVDTPADCPSGTTDGSTCVDRQTLVQALAPAYGNAICNVPYSPIKSCHFYDMDNEPEIWNGSHRDAHPIQPGYTELSNNFVRVGQEMKNWDPDAVTFGPVTCCWYFLWMSGGADGKGSHAGIDFAPWWLNQVNWMDRVNGKRSFDVFDIHAYFGDNIDTTGFSNHKMRAEVGKFVRQYWDPTYYNSGFDADWITTTQPNRGVAFIIPRMKALVNAIYPGTPLSFTEWESFFNEWEFATALSDADAYGSMGRDGVSFSTRWGGPSATDGTTNLPHANYHSFQLFTNYDGNKHGFGTTSVSDQSSANPDLFVSYAALDATGTKMTIMVLNKDPGNIADVTFNLNGFSASSFKSYAVTSTNPGAITTSATQSWSSTQTFAPYSITLLVVTGTQNPAPASEWYLNPDDLQVPASGTGTLQPAITSGAMPVNLTSAVFDAFEGAPACSGSLTLNNPTITPTQTGTITVNAGSALGFCHYTVTGTDGTATQTQGGWIVVGQPAGTFTIQAGNNQSGSAGTVLSTPLTVTVTPPAGTTFTAGGASVLFSTSAGTLSNGSTTGTSVIATTNSAGVASVTLTLPSNSGTVTVSAQDQFALGGASVTFTEKAN